MTRAKNVLSAGVTPKDAMARGQQKSVTGMRSGKAGGRRPSFNPAGAGKTLVRQMMLLPIMYIGSTMDWTATATFYAEATLLGVLVLGSLAIQVSIFLAQRKKEVAKVFDVGDATLMLDAEQINADGSVAAHAYDTAKLKMLRMQLIIAGVVVWFVHVRMGYQVPLLAGSFGLVVQLWDCKGLRIHLLGAAEKRPWGTTAANPVLRWAEKQKVDESKALAKAAKGGAASGTGTGKSSKKGR